MAEPLTTQAHIDAARLLGRIRTYHGVQIPEPAARMAVDLIADLLAERDAELVRWVQRNDELKHKNQCLHNHIGALLDDIFSRNAVADDTVAIVEQPEPGQQSLVIDDDGPTIAELTDITYRCGGPDL